MPEEAAVWVLNDVALQTKTQLCQTVGLANPASAGSKLDLPSGCSGVLKGCGAKSLLAGFHGGGMSRFNVMAS